MQRLQRIHFSPRCLPPALVFGQIDNVRRCRGDRKMRGSKLIMYAGVWGGAPAQAPWGRAQPPARFSGALPPAVDWGSSGALPPACRRLCLVGAFPRSPCRCPPACHFERSNRAPPALLSLEMGVPCSSSSWKGRRRSRGALLVAHAPSDKGLSAYQALTWGSLAPYRDPGATHGRGARAWTDAQQPGSGRWAGTATTACPRTNAFEPNRLRPQAQ